MSDRLAVHIETGRKRTFAGALEWPGWSRSGRSEEEAVASLLAYGGRYAAALAAGGVEALASMGGAETTLEVVERLEGGSGTDFGVPSMMPSADAQPIPEEESVRLVSILRAAWSAFDAAVGSAHGHELRLGPRGGGRDLAKIVAHVREAEQAYLTQLGVKPPRLPGADDDALAQAVRMRATDAVAAIAAGRALEDANRVAKPWTPRYHVRRAAWHALDHAWEIEDRRLP